VKLCSANVFDCGTEQASDDIWICDGRIVDAKLRFWQARESKEFAADIEVDCSGLCICPGFIDWQLNGAIGVDFSCGDDGRSLTEGVSAVAAHVAKHGVTVFCPTIITSSSDVYKSCVPHFKPFAGGQAGASAIGLHLEGPCLNAKRNGAHDRALLQTPSSFKQVYCCPPTHVKVVTLAPELDKGFSFMKELKSLGIVVSLGHSNASLPEAQQAIAAGATAVTHMFNAMSGFHHRDLDSGIVGLLGEPDCDMSFGLIVDGIHAQRNACRVARQCAPHAFLHCIFVTI
jgi:N-acetylglucosamine-6-phosphate deacetylase